MQKQTYLAYIGNEYLDCLSGIGVTSLGHNHPAINQALFSQANKLWHISNLFTIPAQQQLAKQLATASKLPQAKNFFVIAALKPLKLP